MSHITDGDLAHGAVLLSRAVTQAAILYDDRADDYRGIIHEAIHDPALDRIAARHLEGADPARSYAITRARQLVHQADSGQFDRAAWIGAATEIMRELTRDA